MQQIPTEGNQQYNTTTLPEDVLNTKTYHSTKNKVSKTQLWRNSDIVQPKWTHPSKTAHNPQETITTKNAHIVKKYKTANHSNPYFISQSNLPNDKANDICVTFYCIYAFNLKTLHPIGNIRFNSFINTM